MAKVIHGNAVADVRGKVGDIVFNRARGGNVVRALSLTAGGVGPHNLLSASHLDTTPGTPPARGSLITGQEAVTKWKELTLGASGSRLISDGTDATWATLDGARVYHSVDQTFASGGENPLALDTERYDNGGIHDPAANSKLTAQKAGVYTISAHIVWDTGVASTPRGLSIWLNATTYIAQLYLATPGVGYCGLSVSTIFHLNINDYVQAYVHQNSGANLKVKAFPDRSPEFAMQQLTSD
jgi:hypothetical protein